MEGQIRAPAGGTGLMTDATFLAEPRSQPLDSSRRAGPGFLAAAATATYRFQAGSDEGVRVVLVGTPVIDNWRGNAAFVPVPAGRRGAN